MAEIRPEPVPRPEWSALPHPGCINVDGKVLLHTDNLLIAMLRFSPHATIHEHDAGWDIDVVCLDGRGLVSVNGVISPFQTSERIHWPAGCMHRLRIEQDAMITLMVEYIPADFPPPPPL